MDARRWVCGLAILFGATAAPAGDLSLDWNPPGGGLRVNFGGPLEDHEFTSRHASPAGYALLQFNLEPEGQKLDHELGLFGYYPVVTLGVRYRF